MAGLRKIQNFQREKSLQDIIEEESANADHQSTRIDILQNRIAELENQLDSDYRGARPEKFRECAACKHMVDEALENHPTLRGLRDEMEKYHFKLIECRNENLLLKRDLSVAKKVVCQELGIEAVDFQDLLKNASSDGFKGRKEKLIVLKEKNNNLSRKVKELEGKAEKPVRSPSEEMVSKSITEDRKVFWRMELEKQKGYHLGDKERTDLAQDNTELRRRAEQDKQRMREMVAEIRMLKGEIFAFSEKSRDDNVIIQSLQNAENQLKNVLEDRSALSRQLMAERNRNKSLQERMDFLRDQLEAFKDRYKDNTDFMDALSDQNKRQQAMLEYEQMMGHQANERFKDELKTMKMNHSLNIGMLEKMQNAINERDMVVQKLQEKLISLTQHMEEMAEKASAAPSELEPSPSQEKRESVTESPPDENAETEESQEQKVDELQLDIVKYKTLYEATKAEEQSLAEMISTLNKKVDFLNVRLVETQQSYLQNDLERKELIEKVKKLENAAKAAKKKGKLWQQKTAAPPSKPMRNKVDELAMKLEVLGEENNFLRSFLANAIAAKAEDFYLYRLVAENTEKHFETSIDAIKSELSAAKKEQEQPETSDEEHPENH